MTEAADANQLIKRLFSAVVEVTLYFISSIFVILNGLRGTTLPVAAILMFCMKYLNHSVLNCILTDL